MNLSEIRKQYPDYDDLSDDQLARGFHQKFYTDMPWNDFKKKIEYVPGRVVETKPIEVEKPSFAKDVALQTAKDVVGVVSKVGAGLAKGATLGAVDIESGEIGIPFTSLKTQVAPPLGESLKETVGVSPEIAESKYIGIPTEFLGIVYPWSITSRLVGYGVNYLKALRIGKNLMKITDTARRTEAAGSIIKKVAARVGQQAVTGGIVGGARVREEDESLLRNVLTTAALGAGLQMLGEGVNVIATSTGFSRYGAYRRLKKDFTDLLYKNRKEPLSKAEVEDVADMAINKAAQDAGLEKLTRKDLNSLRKSVKDIRGKVEKARAERGEPVAEPRPEEAVAETQTQKQAFLRRIGQDVADPANPITPANVAFMGENPAVQALGITQEELNAVATKAVGDTIVASTTADVFASGDRAVEQFLEEAKDVEPLEIMEEPKKAVPREPTPLQLVKREAVAEEKVEPKQVHDYSNTQVNIPEKEASEVRSFAKEIPDAEIYEDPKDDSYGRIDDPHVTVRYGMETLDPKEIEPAFKGVGPIKIKMGKVSIFETDKYDVVKIDIESEDLEKANKQVGETVDLPGETHKEYKPHATIAYVKKGEGKKYIGNTFFEGKEITIDEITLISKDGKVHPIKLTGKEEIIEEAKPIATFAHYWEVPGKEPIPFYTVKGGRYDGSTIAAKTLEKEGIAIPETPEKPVKVEKPPTEAIGVPGIEEKAEAKGEVIPKVKDEIDSLIEQYEATGRVAHRYPKKKEISLSGRTMSEKVAITKMKEVIKGEAPKAKETWEMTKKEIEEEHAFEDINTYALHTNAIQQALSKNKPVPRHVLEEYKGEKWADEALKKSRPKKIGDAQKVMGIDAIVAKTERIDGIDYELYNANALKDKRGIVRAYDVESGNVISMKEYPTYDQAETAYNDAIKALKKNPPPIKKGAAKAIPKAKATKSVILKDKKQLLADIDKAIEKAPESGTETAENMMHFDIDGGADIWNTEAALKEFRSRVAKTAESKPLTITKISESRESAPTLEKEVDQTIKMYGEASKAADIIERQSKKLEPTEREQVKHQRLIDELRRRAEITSVPEDQVSDRFSEVEKKVKAEAYELEKSKAMQAKEERRQQAKKAIKRHSSYKELTKLIKEHDEYGKIDFTRTKGELENDPLNYQGAEYTKSGKRLTKHRGRIKEIQEKIAKDLNIRRGYSEYARAFGGGRRKTEGDFDLSTYWTEEAKKGETEEIEEKIEDFGEKIGGARKDTAERGYTMTRKAIKEGEGIEPWRKKFVAMERVDGTGWTIGKAGDKFGISRRPGQVFASKEEAEATIPIFAVAENHRVYNDRENKDEWSIFKRVGKRKLFKVVGKTFPSREEGMKYMTLHAEEILNIKTAFGEEILPIPEIAVRKGVERRTKDATPEMFMETFVPRGIEFGNWNNQEERQQVLNHAYDGLLDLAEVLNIPPKALMLDGDLAIAFGARGHGLSAAKAHYEPKYGVINLTKMRGAGSLAHEWFHALDHYFARQDTKAIAEREKDKHGNLVYKTKAGRYSFQSYGPSYKSKVRPKLQEAYDILMATMFRKAEKYVDDMTYAEKFFGAARDQLEKQISSIRNDLDQDLTKTYTWRKNKRGLLPASNEQLTEFDTLTKILIEGGNLETKFIASEKTRRYGGGRYSNETLEAISKILKSVRNRNGFTSDHAGLLDRLSAAMRTYSERLKLFDDAKKRIEKTKKIPTSYAVEAKKMDQARTGDYWSEPHEMAARAFSSYIEDKIAGQGNQSDFIVYHAHGGIFLPMIDGYVARPYPEGTERVAINEAFDKLFEIMESKETERGVSLLRLEPALEAELQGYSFTKRQQKNAIRTAPLVVNWLKRAGADKEVLDRITVELKPFIDLRGKNITKTLRDWSTEGVDMGRILGATTFSKYHALIQLAMNGQNIAGLERSTYHEWYHVAKRWMLPQSDVNALAKHFKTEESEADSFADYMKNSKTTDKEPGFIKRLFLKLKRMINIIRNGLKGMGFKRPEDIFGKIRTGAYKPKARGAETTAVGMKGETRATLSGLDFEMLKEDKSVFWHGTPSGDLRGSHYGLHVGTYQAAKEALNARIGIPAEGEWDGTREYGKTLLAGKKRLKELDPKEFNQTGFNAGEDIPEKNYYPTQRKQIAKYSDRSEVLFNSKPNIFPVRIKGKMTNTPYTPHEDFKANALMARQIKKGKAKKGYYYEQVGEDAGSISAVVPNLQHLEMITEETKLSLEKDLSKEEKLANEYVEKALGKVQETKVTELEPEEVSPEAYEKIKAQEAQKPIEKLIAQAKNDERLIYHVRSTLKKAMSIGKKEGIAKQKAHYQEVVARAKARKEQIAKIRKMIDELKKVDTEKMSPQEAEPVKDLLEGINLVKPTKRTVARLTKTREYLESDYDAELPGYVMENLKRLDKSNIRDMSVEEIASIHTAVMHYIHLNKLKNTIKVRREARRKAEVLRASVAEMKPPKKVKDEIVSSQKSKVGRTKKTAKLITDTFGIRHDHYDLIIESLAGQNSTMDKVLYQGIKEGIIEQLKYKQDTYKKFLKDLGDDFSEKHGIDDIGKWLNEEVVTGKFRLTRGERMALLRHALNEGNLRHLLAGGFGFRTSDTPNRVYKITAKELNEILQSLTPAEKHFAGDPVNKLFEEQYKRLNDVFYAKNGYPLPKTTDPYYPIEVMPITLGTDLETVEALEQFKGKWTRIGLEKGMLEKRVKSRKPLYLSSIVFDINRSVMKSAAYVGLELPLSNASKLLYDQYFRTELENRYGKQTWREIEKGLRDIAGDYQSYTTVEEMALKLKNNLSVAMLGVNPFVMFKQVLSLPIYLPYVKAEYMIQGMIDFTVHPIEVSERHKIFSPEYLERVEGGYSRDVADVFKGAAMKRLYAGRTTVKEKFMGGIQLFDRTAVSAGMQGAVLQVLDEFAQGKLSKEVRIALDMKDSDIMNLTPAQKMKQAYKFADYTTERTQPMFSPEHRSSLSRGATLEKLATMFGAFTNQALNLMRRTYREVRRTGDKAAYAKCAKALFLILVVNTMGVMAIDEIRNRLYGRKGTSIAGRILNTWTGYMFFVRDLASSVISKIEKGTFLGYDVELPIQRVPELLSNVIANGVKVFTEKSDKKRSKAATRFVDDAFNLILTMQGIPYETPKKLIVSATKQKKEATAAY